MNVDYFVKKTLDNAVNTYSIEKDIENGKIFDTSVDEAEWVSRYFYSHHLPEIMINIMDDASRDSFLAACEELIDAKIKAITAMNKEADNGEHVRVNAISYGA